MKVDYSSSSYNVIRDAKNASHPQFKGNANLGKQITEHLPNKRLIETMNKFEWLRGEAGGILINSIGTGAVAPIFIACNPFVKAPKDATPEQKKELKNTTIYTAWRQPISAVLAIIIQLGVQKPINLALDALFNNPNTAKNLWIDLDQSALNNDSYAKRKVAKEMKNVKFATKEAYTEELNKRTKARVNEQINALIPELKDNGIIKIGDRTVESSKVAEILNAQIDNYIEDARKLKISEKALKYYKDRATLLMNNQDELKRILDENALPKDAQKLTGYLKGEAEKAKGNKELKGLLEEIAGYHESIRASKCKRTLERIDKINQACNGNFTPEKYLESMLKDNELLDKLIINLKDDKIAKIENASPEGIKNAIKKVFEHCSYSANSRLRRICNNTETFQLASENFMKKITKDVIKGYRGSIGNKYKGFNQMTKIIIGAFITTPITCTALNWVYPRFMDIFFPKLSGAKKKAAEAKNGGEK